MKEHDSRVGRPRRLLRLAIIAVAIVVPSLAVAVPAQASPTIYTSCGYGASSGNVYTCNHTKRDGAYLYYVEASATVINSARTIQVCARAPWGTMACSAFYTVYPGATLDIYAYENAYVPEGYYCANTWRRNSDGTHTEIGHQCVYIP